MTPRLWSRFPGRYLFTITGSGGGSWLCEVGSEPTIVPYEGFVVGGSVDCEILLSAKDFIALASGALNPQLAHLNRQIRVRGRVKYALRLNLLLDRLIGLSVPWFGSRGYGADGAALRA